MWMKLRSSSCYVNSFHRRTVFDDIQTAINGLFWHHLRSFWWRFHCLNDCMYWKLLIASVASKKNQQTMTMAASLITIQPNVDLENFTLLSVQRQVSFLEKCITVWVVRVLMWIGMKSKNMNWRWKYKDGTPIPSKARLRNLRSSSVNFFCPNSFSRVAVSWKSLSSSISFKVWCQNAQQHFSHTNEIDSKFWGFAKKKKMYLLHKWSLFAPTTNPNPSIFLFLGQTDVHAHQQKSVEPLSRNNWKFLGQETNKTQKRFEFLVVSALLLFGCLFLF